MTQELFDAGLQPERTLLAWRRTCLSFGLASVVAMRFTVEVAGVVAALLGVVGAGLAASAYFAASVGYRRATAALERSAVLSRSGWPMLFATLAALMLGAACAGYLVLGALGG